jgi:hypothetical protein
MLFTIVRCGFKPRCALEIVDGAATRISKIEKLIEECPLGINDISRTEADPASGLPRFNMPLELGLFLGAKRYGDEKQRRKKCLVMDREQYRYQAFMSDIAGQDIFAHGNETGRVINAVRSFLNSVKRGDPLPSAAMIEADFAAFNRSLPEICLPLHVDPSALDYRDFIWSAGQYLLALV